MSHNYQIRTAHFEDIPALLELIKSQTVPIDGFDHPTHFHHLLDHRKHYIAVVEDEMGAMIAAMGVRFPALRPWVVMEFFVVHPKAQGAGVAQGLLTHVEHTLKGRMFRTFVRSDNHKAIKFFKKQLFTLKAIRKDNYKDGMDALVFMKKVPKQWA